MDSYFVWIIIPTYNDWIRLSKCLDALTRQTYSKNKFEIIVVNNNSESYTPDKYSIPENCSEITETRSNSYAARNAALKVAQGEIIGFAGSDCILDNNWG